MTKTSDTAPHVIRAMSQVTARLAEVGVSKSRNNSQQGYKFRGIDEIMNAMAAIIASEKLVIVPHVQERALTERISKGGTVLFSVVVRVEYTFVSAEDGSREVVGPFDGEAMDSADKGTNKAMSAAYKYMAIQTFCIPTEVDSDADATMHEVAPDACVTPEQLAALQERIEATGADIAKFCAYLRIEALPDLKARDYDRALSALAAKGRKP